MHPLMSMRCGCAEDSNGGSHIDAFSWRELVSTTYFLINYKRDSVADHPAPAVVDAFDGPNSFIAWCHLTITPHRNELTLLHLYV